MNSEKLIPRALGGIGMFLIGIALYGYLEKDKTKSIEFLDNDMLIISFFIVGVLLTIYDLKFTILELIQRKKEKENE